MAASVAPSSPAGAADEPALAPSTTELDVVLVGDDIAFTLTGCEGPDAPEILRIVVPQAPDTQEVPVPVVEIAPGTWQTTGEVAAEGDAHYVGRCASGARSAEAIIDVEWREMWTVPFQDLPVPLERVTGTDCSDGAVRVGFRSEDRTWWSSPEPVPGGDWEAPAPSDLPDATVHVRGECGAYRYIGLSWAGSGGSPSEIQPFAWIFEGQGPPGTVVDGDIVCGTLDGPTVVVDDGSGDPQPVPVVQDTATRWTFSFTAGPTDPVALVTCGPQRDRLRFVVTGAEPAAPTTVPGVAPRSDDPAVAPAAARPVVAAPAYTG